MQTPPGGRGVGWKKKKKGIGYRPRFIALALIFILFLFLGLKTDPHSGGNGLVQSVSQECSGKRKRDRSFRLPPSV